ncbi:MAG: LptF/LptG family permease [Rickettsiaceae bacterium]|nr:LptF/LptG family permease [Rickettsiaceae bacterium]
MNIYKRYIISNVASQFGAVLATITALVWLSQVMKMLSLLDKGIKFLDFIYITILLLPSLLFPILPFAITVGAIITYRRLTYDREIIVLSNSGINHWGLMKPALVVAAVATILSYSISLYLLPKSTMILKSKMSYMRENYASSLVLEKTFTNIAKGVVLYIDEKKSDGTYMNIVIFDDRNNKSVIFANNGHVSFSSGSPSLELNHGLRQEIDKRGHLNEMGFESLSISLANNKNEENLIKQTDYYKNKDLNEYYINELIFPHESLSPSRKMKMLAEAHQRILWPLYSITMTFLALSIFMQKPYSRRESNDIIWKTTAVLTGFVIIHFVFFNIASKEPIFAIFCYINIVLSVILGYLLTIRTIGKKYLFSTFAKIARLSPRAGE